MADGADNRRQQDTGHAGPDELLNRIIVPPTRALVRNWLVVVCLALVVFTALPLAAPWLMARGQTTPASLIYTAYRMTCHQLPQRSFFLGGPQATYSESEIKSQTSTEPLNDYTGSAQAGYKMAYCERDTAMYLSILAMAVLFLFAGWRLPRLPLWLFALMIAPLAIDGVTQLIGVRESTWQLRLVTGLLFGIAIAWLLFPVVDEAMKKAESEIGTR
jgi:uncharacterized membrane protein